jgi:hypothetical protein
MLFDIRYEKFEETHAHNNSSFINKIYVVARARAHVDITLHSAKCSCELLYVTQLCTSHVVQQLSLPVSWIRQSGH